MYRGALQGVPRVPVTSTDSHTARDPKLRATAEGIRSRDYPIHMRSAVYRCELRGNLSSDGGELPTALRRNRGLRRVLNSTRDGRFRPPHPVVVKRRHEGSGAYGSQGCSPVPKEPKATCCASARAFATPCPVSGVRASRPWGHRAQEETRHTDPVRAAAVARRSTIRSAPEPSCSGGA